MKKIFALLLVVLLVVSFTACGSGVAAASEPTPEPTTEPPTTQTEVATHEKLTNACAYINDQCFPAFEYKNAYVSGDGLVVSIAQEGMEDVVTLVKEYNITSIQDQWGTIRETTVSGYNKIVTEILPLFEINDVTVTFNLVGDVNHNKLLVSCIDGNIVYDILSDDTDIAPTETPEPDKEITIGMKNALASAKSYLSFSAFSYTGLIGQLEYEGYTTEEATYAVDNCGADWNEQAARCAESYLKYSSFSRTGLIEQLEYEGFTYAQAVYGVEANGY